MVVIFPVLAQFEWALCRDCAGLDTTQPGVHVYSEQRFQGLSGGIETDCSTGCAKTCSGECAKTCSGETVSIDQRHVLLL